MFLKAMVLVFLLLSIGALFTGLYHLITAKESSVKTYQSLKNKVFMLQKGEGALTILPPVKAYLSEHKHLAYALQWFLLSIAGLVILTLSSIRKGALVV